MQDHWSRTLCVTLPAQDETESICVEEDLADSPHAQLRATAMYLLRGPLPGGAAGWLPPGATLGVEALAEALQQRPELTPEQYEEWKKRGRSKLNHNDEGLQGWDDDEA